MEFIEASKRIVIFTFTYTTNDDVLFLIETDDYHREAFKYVLKVTTSTSKDGFPQYTYNKDITVRYTDTATVKFNSAFDSKEGLK